VIRFWDTSGLVKLYSAAEPGHAKAINLLHEKHTGALRHQTSMLVLVELTSVLVRRTGRRAVARRAIEQLEHFEQVELTEQHRDLAVQLAMTGATRGADTAIAAQALVVAADARQRVEFISADRDQSRLVSTEAKRRGLRLRTIVLPL
jgi:predicted nucleic acid-binding protein